VENLAAEGVRSDRVHLVGNVMIDSLVAALPAASAFGAPARHRVAERSYVVVTLHRPCNVDDAATLRELLEALVLLGKTAPVLFPVHPRTRARIAALGMPGLNGGLQLLEPMPYVEMLGLVSAADLVITDSGGLQEETTYLGVPCVTVRPGTERPITCTEGTNRLAPPEREAIRQAAAAARSRRRSTPATIERWDGKAAERIAAVICDGARFD